MSYGNNYGKISGGGDYLYETSATVIITQLYKHINSFADFGPNSAMGLWHYGHKIIVIINKKFSKERIP